MKLKTLLVASLAVAGCVASGNLAAAALGVIYCANWIHCDNSTSCHMTGGMADKMYQVEAQLYNGTRALPLTNSNMQSVKKGQAACFYTTDGNWPSSVVFFSDAKRFLAAANGTGTKWEMEGDNAFCMGPKPACPFTTKRPSLG
jgi:hypothetical protein